MAVNVSRSLNASMREGATDSTYKKVVNDRDGYLDPVNITEKGLIAPEVYGQVGEVRAKVMPDGTTGMTPNYRPL